MRSTRTGATCLGTDSGSQAFPFDPSPDWTRFYSSGAEIQAYIKRTAKKWSLDRDVYLNTRVKSATWQPEPGVWAIVVEHNGVRRTEHAEILISAQGGLDTYKWPNNIPGLDTFTGKKTHSAAWDHDFDYSHKRIAVIGNGSSGIQIVPQLIKLEGTRVMNFARGPAWIYYRVPPSQHLGTSDNAEVDKNPMYTEEQKTEFRCNPESMKQHRKAMIARTNKAFRMVSDSTAVHTNVPMFQSC
jgi:cation diffusion facilitator CzcD-associated flavoprotein CzcO